MTLWTHESETTGGSVHGAAGRLRAVFHVRETVLRHVPGEGALRGLRIERIEAERQPEGAATPERWDSAAGADGGGPGGADGAAPAGTQGPAFEGRSHILRRLVGLEFNMQCAPTGDAIGFDLLDAAREKATAGLDAEAPGRAFLEHFLGPTSLRVLLGPPVRVPTEPVAPAEGWPYVEVRILPAESAGIPAVLYCVGTGALAGSAEGIARIEVSGKVLLDPPDGAPAIPEALRPVRELLRLKEGTFSAFARVETATGRLVEAEHVMDLDLVFMPPGGARDVEFPHRIVSRMRR